MGLRKARDGAWHDGMGMAEKIVRDTGKHEEEEEYCSQSAEVMANPLTMLLSFLTLAGDAMEI